MPKRIDFAARRRVEGRAASAAVSELKSLISQLGPEITTTLEETAARRELDRHRLVERLQESVVPLFIHDSTRGLDRIGTCVLVRLGADCFAFTAAHVVRAIGAATVLLPSEGKGGKLVRLPPCNAHLSPADAHNDLDVAVLSLAADQLDAFHQRVFLADGDIDHEDQPDHHEVSSSYLVLGYPASWTQVRISNEKRHIDQQSFHCMTQPVSGPEYAHEGLPQADHLVLDYDHKEIKVKGKLSSPPKLQGVSGGGIFHISRAMRQGPLVAIATQNRRGSRLIVGTKVKHFLAMARELKMSR